MALDSIGPHCQKSINLDEKTPKRSSCVSFIFHACEDDNLIKLSLPYPFMLRKYTHLVDLTTGVRMFFFFDSLNPV